MIFSGIKPAFSVVISVEHPDVVSIFPNGFRKLHTTHSWDFLGLEKDGVIHRSSLWKKAKFGENVIIANLDTGYVLSEFIIVFV